jgi:hypothetical protein
MQGRRYRPTTTWARAILLRLHRWLPDRLLVAVMDGEFAALTLLDAISPHMVAITRLVLQPVSHGLAKTRLQHVAIAAAMNLVRIGNWMAGVPIAPTRRSHFGQLVEFARTS